MIQPRSGARDDACAKLSAEVPRTAWVTAVGLVMLNPIDSEVENLFSDAMAVGLATINHEALSRMHPASDDVFEMG